MALTRRYSMCPHEEVRETGGNIKPNGNKGQCQCVMCHCGAYVDGTVEQCHERRWSQSNQFCANCEQEHGEKWRQMYGMEESE